MQMCSQGACEETDKKSFLLTSEVQQSNKTFIPQTFFSFLLFNFFSTSKMAWNYNFISIYNLIAHIFSVVVSRIA